MNKINRSVMSKIADETIDYLKSRMLLNQDLISKKQNNMDFKTFMALYNKYKYAIKIQRAVSKKKLIETTPEGRNILKSRKEFIMNYADSIVLTEKDIDELMGYVREFIEEYGIPSLNSQNETRFLINVLNELKDSFELDSTGNTNQKYERICDFESYFRLTYNQGFCPILSGEICSDSDSIFKIINHEHNIICEFDNNGINVVNKPVNEDIYIASKMYFGSMLVNNPNGKGFLKIVDIFLEVIENGESKLKSIFYNNKLYYKNSVYLKGKLNDVLDSEDLSFLVQDIYDRSSLRNLVNCFNNSLNMTIEDKNKIESAVSAAVDWWANVICHPDFDNGDKNSLGKIYMITAQLNNLIKLPPKNENIEKFKEKLGNIIKRSLFNDNSITLVVNYMPDINLSTAVEEAKLDVSFPSHVDMYVSKDEVSVQCGVGTSIEILYSSYRKNY